MGALSSLVANFVNLHRGPFTVQLVCDMCNLKATQVAPVLRRFLENGLICKADEGMYLRKARDIQISSAGGWNYSTEMAREILKIIGKGGISSCRTLAQEIGYSRQYAWKYLATLASIGCVERSGKYYAVINEDISRLGDTEPGILRDMWRKR